MQLGIFRFKLLFAFLIGCGGLSAATLLAADPPGGARFKLPEGFTVEQVAAPPLVRYPLFVCFDDRGRMYVAEGTGTNLPGAELAGKHLGRILLLEDVDGDGRFDTSKVFADKLVFPQGILWHDGAVYTASHPSFWRLEDTDGDDRADRREELLSGFKFNGNGCDIHGPFLGPDGRLYWTDGRHGYQVKTRDGEQMEGLASRVWRSRTDGTGVERLCGGGFDNPVEVVFTPEGDLIGVMDQGTGDALLHYVEGAVFAMEHPCLKEFLMTGPLLPVMKQYSAALPAGLCGMTTCRTAYLGTPYQNTVLTTYYVQHKIAQYAIDRDGSTYRAEDRDFLSTDDHDVRITDVEEDADGTLLFVDMGGWFSYGFPGNPLPKPEKLGAIYRVRRTGGKPLLDPWGKSLKLAERSAGELAALFDDPRPRVRDLAIAHLARRGEAAIPAASAVLNDKSRSIEARRNAVWTLCRMESPQALGALRQGLKDADASVRQAAVHAVGLHRDAAAQTELLAMLAAEEPPLRLKVAEALGRIGSADSVPGLLGAVARGGDRHLEHALIYALIRINDRPAISAALDDANPRVRRAGLIALDQMPAGALRREEVVPLLDTDDADLQRTALEIITRHEGWAADTLQLLRDWLLAGERSPEQMRSLTGALLAFSGEEQIQRLVAEVFEEPNVTVATRLVLLQVIGRCRLDELPQGWLDVIGQALAGGEQAVKQEAVAAVKLRNLDRFDAQLAELGRAAELPAELRIAALECVAPRSGPPDGKTFRFLADQLSPDADPLLRIAAARTLGASTLAESQLVELASHASQAGTMTVRLLLSAFARSQSAKVGDALVAALARSPSAEALSTAELDQTLRGFPPEVRKQAAELRQRLAERHERQAAYLQEISADLGSLAGRAEAGRELFFSQKVGCYGCHRIAGKGGAVGPDLSQVGRFRNRQELLESVLFPGFVVVPEFRAYTIATVAGKTVTGLIVRETAAAIDLRTADLAEIRIPRGEIEAIEPAAISLMPDGLEKVMSRQDLGDLLEFLGQQK